MSTVDFDSMDIGKLRAVASMMELAVPKTATKEEILSLVKNKRSTMATTLPGQAVDVLPPGHSRITIHEDTRNGAKNMPVYINANGLELLLHRGKEIVVPNKVTKVLEQAVANTYKQIEDDEVRGGMRSIRVKVLSYPFTVHERREGAQVLTNFEKQKARANAPRKRYKDMFGYYPRPAQLNNAIEKGLIDLHLTETITLGEEQAAEAKKEE